MKHLGLIKFVNMEVLQQAANFDNWKVFVLCAGIVSLLASGVFDFGSLKEFQMYSRSHNSVVVEMIYILGVRMELERPATFGSEPATASSVAMSTSSSMASIFGYDDSFKWTFAGRRPLPRDDSANEGNEKTLEEAD